MFVWVELAKHEPKRHIAVQIFDLKRAYSNVEARFTEHVEGLKPSIGRLEEMMPVKPNRLPRDMPLEGVYLLSEGSRHLYVGRSNNIRKRLYRHSGPGATHRMAAFAFKLAREATGNLRATYKKGKGSRAALMEDVDFAKAISDAKARIRQMDVRFVGEADPIRQALLEIYVAVVLSTPYNDFENH